MVQTAGNEPIINRWEDVLVICSFCGYCVLSKIDDQTGTQFYKDDPKIVNADDLKSVVDDTVSEEEEVAPARKTKRKYTKKAKPQLETPKVLSQEALREKIMGQPKGRQCIECHQVKKFLREGAKCKECKGKPAGEQGSGSDESAEIFFKGLTFADCDKIADEIDAIHDDEQLTEIAGQYDLTLEEIKKLKARVKSWWAKQV